VDSYSRLLHGPPLGNWTAFAKLALSWAKTTLLPEYHPLHTAVVDVLHSLAGWNHFPLEFFSPFFDEDGEKVSIRNFN
jgi:hypothetical protein